MASCTVAGFPFWFIQSGWASLCARTFVVLLIWSSYLVDFLLLEQRTLLTFMVNKVSDGWNLVSQHISICDIDLVIKYEMLLLKYVIKFSSKLITTCLIISSVASCLGYSQILFFMSVTALDDQNDKHIADYIDDSFNLKL